MNNRTALVVGASQGIGEALTKELLQNGYSNFVLVSRNLEKLKAAQSRLQINDQNTLCLQADALDTERAVEVVNQSVQHFGQIDLGLLIVGGGSQCWMENSTVKEVMAFMELNYKTMLNYFFPLVRQMKKQKQGQIVHMNSLAAYSYMPTLAHYGAAKAAALSFLQSVAPELKQHNIFITSLCPGPMDTPGFRNKNPNEKPIGMLDADKAAKKMIKYIIRRKKMANLPGFMYQSIQWMKSIPPFQNKIQKIMMTKYEQK